MDTEGWNVVDDDARVLWREYSFSKNAYSTTLVFRGTDGLVVVSPGTGLSDREYDALREHGEVRALVANNHFHHLGQAAWRARFPDAQSYAPAGALQALEKKVPDIRFQPLSALELPAHVDGAEPPGYKTGDVFFSVRTKKGSVWFTSDLVTNIQRTPGPPVVWLFTLTNSGPGYRLFKLGVWLFVRDRRPLRDWMLDRLAKDPPSVVVPAHGPALEASDIASLTKVQLERL